MNILKLIIVFAFVMGLVAKKVPLSLSVLLGSLATWLLYGIAFADVTAGIYRAVFSYDTLRLILVMYLITFLQRMMEKRGALELARVSLSKLFNNRWVNCVAAPFFIGLLPSPNAAFIAGDMVSASTDDCLTKEQQAVTTSFFRHVSEAFLPTYNSILMALTLTGISAGDFVIGMIPMVIVIVVLGMLFFLKGKVPMDAGETPSENKWIDFKNLIIGVWAIFLAIGLVIFFGIDVVYATLISLVLYFIFHKFNFSEIKPFFKSAFETRIVFNTCAVMIFKELLTLSGVINELPDFFSQFPIPPFLIFVLIFLFGTIIAGSLAIIVLVLPVAMVTVPDAGLPLLILLMSTTYTAMQVSPTHICLTLIAEHFGVSLGCMIKQTVPLLIVFMFIAIGYYLACTMLFI